MAVAEAELHSEFNHEHIIRLLGVCHNTDGVWIISELAKYGSLYDILHGTIGNEDLENHLAAFRIDNTWIRDKSLLLPLSVVLEWALHICSAMRYLHQCDPPVIHRDLKSANVLLATAPGTSHSHSGGWLPVSLKLCDFGTSREVDQDLSSLQTFAGTLAWTAPEILRCDGQGYTLSADVYSFGVVLWELITRAVPFAEIGPFDIARNVLEHNRRPPIPAQTPNVLTNLLKQCWEQQPMRRPQFSAIYSALDSIGQRGAGSEQNTLGTMSAEHFAMRLNRLAVKKYIEEANSEMLTAAATLQKAPSISAEDEGRRRQDELEKWAIELSHRENNLQHKLKNMQSAHDADMSIVNKLRALAVAQGGGLSELQAAELAIEPFISKWSRAAGGGLGPLSIDTDTITRELSNPSSLCTPEVTEDETGDAFKRPSERVNDVLVRPKPKEKEPPYARPPSPLQSRRGQADPKARETGQVQRDVTSQTQRRDGGAGKTRAESCNDIHRKASAPVKPAAVDSAAKMKKVNSQPTHHSTAEVDDTWSVDVTESPLLVGRGGVGVVTPSPPSIMFVGNTHRATGDENLPHAWSVFVTDRPDALGECASVACVEVKLHPTFKPSSITLDQHRKISRERRSFMPFVVQFTIVFHPSVHLKHQRVTVKHTLCLADEGSIQVVEVPLKDTHECAHRHSGSSYSRQGFNAEALGPDQPQQTRAQRSRQRAESLEEEEWLYVDTSLQCRMIQKGPS